MPKKSLIVPTLTVLLTLSAVQNNNKTFEFAGEGLPKIKSEMVSSPENAKHLLERMISSRRPSLPNVNGIFLPEDVEWSYVANDGSAGCLPKYIIEGKGNCEFKNILKKKVRCLSFKGLEHYKLRFNYYKFRVIDELINREFKFDRKQEVYQNNVINWYSLTPSSGLKLGLEQFWTGSEPYTDQNATSKTIVIQIKGNGFDYDMRLEFKFTNDINQFVVDEMILEGEGTDQQLRINRTYGHSIILNAPRDAGSLREFYDVVLSDFQNSENIYDRIVIRDKSAPTEGEVKILKTLCEGMIKKLSNVKK